MSELKKIDPISAGKVAGAIMAIMGFFVGLVITLMSLAFSTMLPTLLSDFVSQTGAGFQTATMLQMLPMLSIIGIVAIIALPIMYGIIGFIYGVVGAAFYNVVAGRIGGIEIELV